MHPVSQDAIFLSAMKVLKFGGSSVGTPGRLREVKKIIDSQAAPAVIVVSALEGVTDQLLRISEKAAEGSNDYRRLLTELLEKHISVALDLITGISKQNAATEKIRQISDELEISLEEIRIMRKPDRHLADLIITAGERLSSIIICSYLEQSILTDFRELIKTNHNSNIPQVDYPVTNKLISEKIGNPAQHVIVPGFIATDFGGKITSLGRGGSDYTAAIISAALKAEALEIWTDVDGFMTADPRKVEKAYTIENLTYAEAMELSHFGAKVIYTPTLRPVYREKIPVAVRNSFRPESKGTLISDRPSGNGKSAIKGISSIDHINLITLQGPAMVGITGTAARLFGALAKNDINIILITQASSEFSITFAVTPDSSSAACETIKDEFRDEIGINKELSILIEKDLSIIAIVGEKMKNTPGISATLFRVLGNNGINVAAMAQGSSELNISVVIKHNSLKKALNAIHDGFFLSSFREVNLFIAGTGVVGSSLIRQLHNQYETLLNEHRLKVNLLGITNSRRMKIDPKGIPLEGCRDALKASEEKSDLAVFIQQMKMMNIRNSVFIDCTSDSKLALKYDEMLASYIAVITANKIACSSEYAYYRKLRSISGERGVRFMYETTVGAGLPVIKTINDLVLSGDKIYKIEAVLSGTMNFIFNVLSKELPLSMAIRLAREKGYSEPDPRTDISGTDVVRKILILGREAGYHIEEQDVEMKGFLPDECFSGDLNDFYKKVENFDAGFEKQREELVRQERKWRFLAVMEEGRAKVELVTVDREHPSYNLDGSNNIVLITTERYRELPLVIKGYGAGADVTAAGVFADLMRVVNV